MPADSPTAGWVRDAVAAGRWLAEAALVPDYALVSSAARARSTFECVAVGIGAAPASRVVDELYGADVDEVLELCSTVPPTAGIALVVGHNPTMAALVQALQREPENEWAPHLPTAGIAVLGHDQEWDSLMAGSGTLDDWHESRG